MLKRRHAATLAAALLSTSGFAADESAGTPLPAPALKSMHVAVTTVTVVDGLATADMQLRSVGRGARIAWTMPPFGWVTMDADDRDPAFSEIAVVADGKALDVERSAAAWLGGHDISADLSARQIDIAHISLGNIDELPSADTPGLGRADRAGAYFRNVDGTLFPAWETRVRAWTDVSAATRRLSYSYRPRPGFFLIAGHPDAAAKRVETYCKPKPGMRDRLLASLSQANLVCLYRLPLPKTDDATRVEWRSHANDDYICSAAGDDTARALQGTAALSGHDLTELRAVSITKDDHCEQ